MIDLWKLYKEFQIKECQIKQEPFKTFSKIEGLGIEVIKLGLLVLLTFAFVTFKVVEIQLTYKIPGLILIGITSGAGLEVLDLLFRDFLIKRRNKKKGFFICKTCNGNGWTPKSSRHWFLRIHKRNHTSGTCFICNGQGYVDWVQNIVGAKGYSNDNVVGSGPPMSGGSSSSV
jgi:hypothetical protein